MRAAQSRSYWKLLRLAQRTRFEIRKKALQSSDIYASTNMAARILTELARITLAPFLLAIGTATVLLLSDIYLSSLNWAWAPVPLHLLEDRDSYATFLSTISAIGGVLIGLYYTGLTAVGSTAYSQVPATLRSLLFREPVGRFYMRALAFATFLSLCLLAFHAIGFSPPRFAVPLLVLLSGVIILSFVRLGQHAFYFYDPTKLARSLFADLERSLRRATATSPFWEDPSFQTHANRQADSALSALRTLADYSAGQKHLRSDALAELAILTIAFLSRYENARQQIPSESKWYPTDYQHPDFYRAGDLKVGMAVQAGGAVQPVSVTQANWVEEAALPVVLSALRSNLEENNERSVFRILSSLLDYVEHLGRTWEIEQGMSIAQQLTETLATKAFTAIRRPSSSPRWHLGLVEHLALLPIRLLLGFAKSFDNDNLETIPSMLSKVRWQAPRTLYLAGFRRFALPNLEWIRPRLEFERMAESGIVTPAWFIQQVIAKDCLTVLRRSADLLLDATGRLYADWYEKSAQANDLWAASIVLNRQGEYISKLKAHAHKITASDVAYQAAKVLTDMLGWPADGPNKLEDRVIGIEREYEVLVANAATRLIGVERPSHIPDFAGEFLARTARALLDSICQNDPGHFGRMFPSFFRASVAKFVRLATQTEPGYEANPAQHLNTVAGPILDLMELSGYAIVASELHETPAPWSTAKASWDEYLLDEKSGAQRVVVLAATLQAADLPLRYPQGEVWRTGWRLRIQEVLRGLPVTRRLMGGPSLHIDSDIRHPSPLIRVLGRQMFGGFYRGTDVFVAIYFGTVSEDTEVMRELRANDLRDAIDREAGRGEHLGDDA